MGSPSGVDPVSWRVRLSTSGSTWLSLEDSEAGRRIGRADTSSWNSACRLASPRGRAWSRT